MKSLTALAMASVLALGACAPSTNADDGQNQTLTQNAGKPSSADAKKTKTVEVSIQLKLKSGHTFTIRF